MVRLDSKRSCWTSPKGHHNRWNSWRRWIDTALDSPHDIIQWETAESVAGYVYRVQARSVVVLFAGTNESNYRRKFGRRTKDTNS